VIKRADFFCFYYERKPSDNVSRELKSTAKCFKDLKDCKDLKDTTYSKD
jgi:hypothetical protein